MNKILQLKEFLLIQELKNLRRKINQLKLLRKKFHKFLTFNNKLYKHYISYRKLTIGERIKELFKFHFKHAFLGKKKYTVYKPFKPLVSKFYIKEED